MKALISSLFIFFCFFSTAWSQRIPAPKPVIVKLTSNMCNVCGLAAWDQFRDIIDKYEKDAVIIAAHPLEESDLFSTTAMDFTNNLPVFWGTPTLYANDQMITPFSIGGVKEYIKSYQKKIPTIHPFIDYNIEGNTLTVNVKTAVLKSSNRSHYLSVYVIEDHVSAYQETRGPEEKHSKILRTHFGENTFGELLAEGGIEKGQEFESNYSIEISPDWNPEHLEIAAIIWEKRGETFDFINANSALEPSSLSTSINELAVAAFEMNIRPTIITNNASIELDLLEAQRGVALTVVNSLGQSVKNIFSGDLASGNHSFVVNRSDYSGSGIYFVILEKEGKKLVKKLVLK